MNEDWLITELVWTLEFWRSTLICEPLSTEWHRELSKGSGLESRRHRKLTVGGGY